MQEVIAARHKVFATKNKAKSVARSAVKRARVLTDDNIAAALEWCRLNSEQPMRDRLMVLLTCRLGLRAQEVAMTHVEDFLDANGNVKDVFFVSKRGAKYGKSRQLPIRPEMREALTEYVTTYPNKRGRLFFNQWGEHLSPNAVHQQLKRIYAAVDLDGCSSHSGRRTFGTRTARKVASMGMSLVDVQHLMGHADILTTSIYVEPSDRIFELVE